MTARRPTDREAFLARVRAALDRSGPAGPAVPDEEAPAVDEGLVRLARSDDDLVEMFARKAHDAGMVVHRCTPLSVVAVLREVLIRGGAATATASVLDGPLEDAVRDAAGEAGCTIVEWRPQPGLDAHFEADIGITDVAAAIAETGTLVMHSGPAHSRGTHLVPPIHVAIVTARDLVPDLIDYWAMRRGSPPRALPSCSLLITGPSKTADIEGILITGVHGPREVHVLLIEDDG